MFRVYLERDFYPDQCEAHLSKWSDEKGWVIFDVEHSYCLHACLWLSLVIGSLVPFDFRGAHSVSVACKQMEPRRTFRFNGCCVCNRYHIATEKEPLNQLKRLPKCYFLTNSFAEGFEEINHQTGGIQT
ncbi:MAG: hypothetical protein EBU08_11435 [Micrococcales bacterium]|nr:hypothetical protein [Micrococcales bacterium]